MENLQDILSVFVKNAFEKAGFNVEKITILPSSMQDMGDYQCNDAFSVGKNYKLNPMIVAEKVVENLKSCEKIKNCTFAKPGFINFFVEDNFLNDYFKNFASSEILNNSNVDVFSAKDYFKNMKKNGTEKQNVIIDYGGANVAKPLHVGHLRTAIIGESIKRIVRECGQNVIGDVHLGDWGLQMGMVINELKHRQPNLVYFDESFNGDYPKESPINIKDLETLYPEASLKAKADENLMNEAKLATLELQKGRRGYVALWNHILNVSKQDLKKNYDALNVHFDLWLGESDCDKYCSKVIDLITQKGFAYESEGALVVDVEKPEDKVSIPPMILKKSDGAILYSTTDLATIYQREKEFNADRIIYVVDNRQAMHFTQVFRCVEKTQILNKKIGLDFVGFGTMNGKDGKPYKTRDGGVMQLGVLINEVKEKALEKIKEIKSNDISYSSDEMTEISNKVAISALKFADLSIYRTKDYIFDPDKFCSFEGKTGPYLLYTLTRAKSILRKNNFVFDNSFELDTQFCNRKIINLLLNCKQEILSAYNSLAPSILCDYVYKLANEFNAFYSSCNIINEKDLNKKKNWLLMTQYVIFVMEKILFLLGIETLEKM